MKHTVESLNQYIKSKGLQGLIICERLTDKHHGSHRVFQFRIKTPWTDTIVTRKGETVEVNHDLDRIVLTSATKFRCSYVEPYLPDVNRVLEALLSRQVDVAMWGARIKAIHGDSLILPEGQPDAPYLKNRDKRNFYCKVCRDTFEARLCNVVNNTQGCPRCNRQGNRIGNNPVTHAPAIVYQISLDGKDGKRYTKIGIAGGYSNSLSRLIAPCQRTRLSAVADALKATRFSHDSHLNIKLENAWRFEKRYEAFITEQAILKKLVAKKLKAPPECTALYKGNTEVFNLLPPVCLEDLLAANNLKALVQGLNCKGGSELASAVNLFEGSQHSQSFASMRVPH